MDGLRRISPQCGTAFLVPRGSFIEIIDPEGAQVADLFCVSQEKPFDALSSGRSIDYNDTIRFTTGNVLYSNSGKELLKIVEDSCGIHDFLVTPCSRQMFQMLDPQCEFHPSCQENLATEMGRFGVPVHLITTTFNIFMHIPVSPDGRIQVLRPLSKAGAKIVFHAARDLIVGLTACADEGSNGGICKPIDFRILEGESP